MKQILALICVALASVACGGNVAQRVMSGGEEISAPAPLATPTPLRWQSIQVHQSGVLPPYGLTVKADVASLNVRVSSSKEVDTADRLEALQQAIAQIAERAANDEKINLQYVSVAQVSSSSSDRETSASAFIGSYDSSSVILELTTNLANDNPNLLESLIVFDSFVKTLNLPETIAIETLAIEAEISNPETYRQQLIAKIYQELAAIQAEYGSSVKFEVTGLHSQLHSIALSDTEYYLYLEPAIVVNEF